MTGILVILLICTCFLFALVDGKYNIFAQASHYRLHCCSLSLKPFSPERFFRWLVIILNSALRFCLELYANNGGALEGF